MTTTRNLMPPATRCSAHLVAAVTAIAMGLVVVLAGCTDLRRTTGTPAVLPGGGTVPQSVVSGDQVWVALSTATPPLTARLIDQLGAVVVPAAIALGRRDGEAVTVQVYALDEATEGQAAQLALVQYPKVTSDTNQLVVQRDINSATAHLLAQVESSMKNRPVAPTEDPVGALTLMADTAAQVADPAQHVLGVLLGDGLSSTDNCDTTLLPAANAGQVAAAAQECLAGAQIELGGTPLWLDGIGLDPTGGQLSSTQLAGAQSILERIIQVSGGRVCRAGPVLLPQTAEC